MRAVALKVGGLAWRLEAYCLHAATLGEVSLDVKRGRLEIERKVGWCRAIDAVERGGH